MKSTYYSRKERKKESGRGRERGRIAALATNLFCKTFTGRAICLSRERNAEAGGTTNRTHVRFVRFARRALVPRGDLFLKSIKEICMSCPWGCLTGIRRREGRGGGWQFRAGEPAVLACVRKEGEKIGEHGTGLAGRKGLAACEKDEIDRCEGKSV